MRGWRLRAYGLTGNNLSEMNTPVSPGAAASDTAGTSSAQRPGVLLVDDQPARLLAYESVLSGLEVRCVRALSGEEALRKLLEQEFAVILLDVNMPGMDGFEVARAIREHPRLERTPIIFVTGVHVSELDRLKGYEVGAIDYIAVPVVPEILRSKIAVLTELYRRRSELLAVNHELSQVRAGSSDRLRADVVSDDTQERYRLAAEAVQGVIYDWNVRTDELHISQGIEDLLGVAAEEVSSCAGWWRSRIHPDDVQALEYRIRSDTGGLPTFLRTELRLRHPDGRWLHVRDQCIVQRAPDGSVARVVGNAIDITDLRLAEQALRDEAARFRLITESIPQLVWSARPDGFSDYYNERFLEYLGLSLEEMQGYTWATAIHPDDAPTGERLWTQAVATGGEYCAEFRIRRGREGSYRWHAVRGTPLRDSLGRIVRWFGTCTDIDDRKRSEEALRESEERYRELAETLEATDRRKDEFLAMLAHELRNPVAPIASAAEVLSRLATADAKASSCVAVIQRQTVHLSRLLDDLLDVARITQRRVVLQREVVSLMSCVEQAIETAEPLIREKRQRLTVVKAPEPLLVSVDKVRIAQSIANVLINAAKYTDRGGEIRVMVFSDASCAAVEVRDSGIGISEQLLPRIFDLFVQSEQPLDRAEGGLGIGLAVCRELVEMHGGTVSAASAGPNRGATFTVRLPVLEAPAESARSGESGAAPQRRILIVDDNRDAADILALLLESEGHETLAVYAAAQALEQVAIFEPDVVLLDIGLPGMDGYEVARRMKLLARPVRLIALSGYGQLEDKQRSSAAGFDAHLVKPVETAVLRQLLAASG